MSDINIDTGTLDAYLYDPEGDVAREIDRRGALVEDAARINTSGAGDGIEWPEVVRTRIPGAAPGTPGRLWIFGGPSGHRSSSPFDHPAIDTGDLTSSIERHMTETEAGPSCDISAGGAEAPYAAYVELGTRYMAERPYLRPALDAAAD